MLDEQVRKRLSRIRDSIPKNRLKPELSRPRVPYDISRQFDYAFRESLKVRLRRHRAHQPKRKKRYPYRLSFLKPSHHSDPWFSDVLSGILRFVFDR